MRPVSKLAWGLTCASISRRVRAGASSASPAAISRTAATSCTSARFEAAAEEADSLPHADDSVATGERPVIGRPPPIVLNGDFDGSSVASHRNADVDGPRMLEHIGQRLLGDAIGREVDSRWDSVLSTAFVDIDHQARLSDLVDQQVEMTEAGLWCELVLVFRLWRHGLERG